MSQPPSSSSSKSLCVLSLSVEGSLGQQSGYPMHLGLHVASQFPELTLGPLALKAGFKHKALCPPACQHHKQSASSCKVSINFDSHKVLVS